MAQDTPEQGMALKETGRKIVAHALRHLAMPESGRVSQDDTPPTGHHPRTCPPSCPDGTRRYMALVQATD